jgi:uncharacterized protein YbaR (Trm112 family)
LFFPGEKISQRGHFRECGNPALKLKGKNMAISKDLLEILACPKCKGDLRLTPTEDGLICDACRLLYEIRDEIPIMLIDEAKKLD